MAKLKEFIHICPNCGAVNGVHIAVQRTCGCICHIPGIGIIVVETKVKGTAA